MSEEVAIISIVSVAKEKRDRFVELTLEAMGWIEKNEPETLQFAIYEEELDDHFKFSLFERYASRAAMDKHESSSQYKEFFGAVMKESLLIGEPQLRKAKYVGAIQR